MKIDCCCGETWNTAAPYPTFPGTFIYVLLHSFPEKDEWFTKSMHVDVVPCANVQELEAVVSMLDREDSCAYSVALRPPSPVRPRDSRLKYIHYTLDYKVLRDAKGK